jgi:hypothetical protein
VEQEQFLTVEKVFSSGVHRAPKNRIDSRVNGNIVQTVSQLATEMWNISCATLVAWLRQNETMEKQNCKTKT